MAADLDRARELVLAQGWNATAYQILNPGIRYWFSSSHAAVVGYSRRERVLLAAGAPVCEERILPAVCDEFEAFARSQRCRVCYVCAERRLKQALPHYGAMAMGAQPAWNPRVWPKVVHRHASLRAQLYRARNKGVEIAAMDSEQAARDVELWRVLSDWVEGRRLPPLHFLVEPAILDGVMRDRRVLVAHRDGLPVAFLVASPVPARRGYLVELLARSGAAPNGTSELLIDAAMQRLGSEGCEYVTLGLVALAHAADPELDRNPLLIRKMMRFARVHANRFYNFRGLERFRLKMDPERWEVVYALSSEPRFSLRTLYAMGGAFSGIPPWAAIAIGLRKAVVEEATGLLHRLLPRDAPVMARQSDSRSTVPSK